MDSKFLSMMCLITIVMNTCQASYDFRGAILMEEDNVKNVFDKLLQHIPYSLFTHLIYVPEYYTSISMKTLEKVCKLVAPDHVKVLIEVPLNTNKENLVYLQKFEKIGKASCVVGAIVAPRSGEENMVLTAVTEASQFLKQRNYSCYLTGSMTSRIPMGLANLVDGVIANSVNLESQLDLNIISKPRSIHHTEGETTSLESTLQFWKGKGFAPQQIALDISFENEALYSYNGSLREHPFGKKANAVTLFPQEKECVQKYMTNVYNKEEGYYYMRNSTHVFVSLFPESAQLQAEYGLKEGLLGYALRSINNDNYPNLKCYPDEFVVAKAINKAVMNFKP